MCYEIDQMKGSNMSDDLDLGYVIMIDQLGTDLDIVNAARVSFNKESTYMTLKDLRLMKYLWQHEHTSPFRMTTLKFKIKAPIFVHGMKPQLDTLRLKKMIFLHLKHGDYNILVLSNQAMGK